MKERGCSGRHGSLVPCFACNISQGFLTWLCLDYGLCFQDRSGNWKTLLSVYSTAFIEYKSWCIFSSIERMMLNNWNICTVLLSRTVEEDCWKKRQIIDQFARPRLWNVNEILTLFVQFDMRRYSARFFAGYQVFSMLTSTVYRGKQKQEQVSLQF